MKNQRILYILLGLVMLFLALYTGYYTYINLDKGFIFNDEAYYLAHYKNEGQSLSFDRTNFFRIFKVFYTSNIYHFRIISISLLAFSNYLLFYSFSTYFKTKTHPILVGFLGIAIAFLTWKASNIALHQYIGNTILINLALTFVILFLLYNRKLFLCVTGFFLGFVLFNGNSHVIAILPILLFVLFATKPKQWLSKLIYFCAGGLIAIIIYFTFMDSIENYINQWSFLKEYLSYHTKQHSKKFFVMWFVYIFMYIVLPTILIIFTFYKVIKSKANNIKYLDYLIIFLGIISIIFKIFYSELFIHLLILFTNILAYRYWLTKNSKQNKFLIIVLLLISYGMCFGSGTWYHLRINVYLIYYYLVILLIIQQIYNYKINVVFILFFLFLSYKFPKFQFSLGWKKYIFVEQTEPVQINGHTLYLDKEKATKIAALKPYLQNQENIIYSNNKLLGYLYILDAYPPIHYYFTLKDYIDFILEKKGVTRDDMIYLESKTYPFHKNEIVPLKYVKHPEKYKVIHVDEFTLYLPSTYQEK